MFSKLFGPEPEWVEISQEELITTAQFYLSVLVDERKEFLSGLDDQMKDKVGTTADIAFLPSINFI